MEHVGSAWAGASRALAVDTERWGRGPIVILCGPGNNGGDGLGAGRPLAAVGGGAGVALVAAPSRRGSGARAVVARGGRASPRAPPRNWARVVRDDRLRIVHAPVARDVALLGHGI